MNTKNIIQVLVLTLILVLSFSPIKWYAADDADMWFDPLDFFQFFDDEPIEDNVSTEVDLVEPYDSFEDFDDFFDDYDVLYDDFDSLNSSDDFEEPFDNFNDSQEWNDDTSVNEEIFNVFVDENNSFEDFSDLDIELNSALDINTQNSQNNPYHSCKAIDDITSETDFNLYNSKFIDIQESLYKNDILRIEKSWIISGRSANTFEPYETLTRAEFLAVALKMHCIDVTQDQTHPFADVELSSWKSRVIGKALAEGIISGETDSNGKKVFRPNDPITRMEVVAILLNLSLQDVPWDRESPYEDIAQQQWQKNYVTKWNELNLFMPNKTHNKFYPNKYIMREHIGSIMYSLAKLYRNNLL